MADEQLQRWAQRPFGRQAHYVESTAHRTGDSLRVLSKYAARGRYRLAVDVSTGPGYTAFALAPVSGQVLAPGEAILPEANP